MFIFNVAETTEIYTLSLHDALPISSDRIRCLSLPDLAERRRLSDRFDYISWVGFLALGQITAVAPPDRSEEHTSELQSQSNLVCRLLLEKKKFKVLINLSKIARSLL